MVDVVMLTYEDMGIRNETPLYLGAPDSKGLLAFCDVLICPSKFVWVF